MPRFRRDAYLISVEGIRAAGGAPGLRFTFGDMRDGKPARFTLSNGVDVNPSPTLDIFRARQGDVARNERINKETLDRLGYRGDMKSAPRLSDFACGFTRPDAKPIEIAWETTEYGNEVQTVGRRGGGEDGAAFFSNADAPSEPEPWDRQGSPPS